MSFDLFLQKGWCRRVVVLTACLLIFILSGCSALYPIDPVTHIVFQDDFQDSASGWPVQAGWQGRMNYQDGAYHMEISAPRALISAALPTNYVFPPDVEIQVDAHSLTGPQDNRFGIICRYQDPFNYYWFVISSDGYYGIGKMKAGQAELINAPQMPPSEIIQQGLDSNHLRVECVGEALRLYVNNSLLAEQSDREFKQGGVGLLVGAGSQPGVQIAFEHLTVKEVVR